MNYKTSLFLVLVLISIVLITGCIDQMVPADETSEKPDTSKYELEVFLDETKNNTFVNTTTFYLSTNQSVKAVHMVKDKKELDIVPIEEIGGVDKGIISDVVVIAENTSTTKGDIQDFKKLADKNEPSDINYTLSDSVVGGQEHIYIQFNESITGFVAYTMDIPSKQDFMYNPTSPSIIRFVLPQGYTTGNPLLGRAQPPPDDVYYDEKDKQNLIWYNFEGDPPSLIDRVRDFTGSDGNSKTQYSKNPVNVKFYQEEAPLMLLIGAMVLSFGALAVVLYYHHSRKKLKEKHEWVEDFESEKRW
ncbi:MAG: DUF5803 family protein [Methanohalobium sp.]|uniref:DUF5803 family protein n=1 Tax=Methanohalobium sp. TaxID=2837493 RepID=UPI00397AD949